MPHVTENSRQVATRIVEPDGYVFGCVKVDRSVDGFMGSVETPAKYSYSGLFATKGSALKWCRHIVARDRRDPLFPTNEEQHAGR